MTDARSADKYALFSFVDVVWHEGSACKNCLDDAGAAYSAFSVVGVEWGEEVDMFFDVAV